MFVTDKIKEGQSIPESNSACLDWEYEASWAAFTTTALAMVGMQPYIRNKTKTHIISVCMVLRHPFCVCNLCTFTVVAAQHHS